MDGATQALEEPASTQTVSVAETKLGTCYRSAGGCGKRFAVPAGEPVPSRCPECKGKPRERANKPGRLYDCKTCGDEFRYRRDVVDEEVGTSKVCNACRKDGPRCLGGCGVRSKKFREGTMTCSECKAKRLSGAGSCAAPASKSTSLLSTGYAKAMTERFAVMKETVAAIAPSPMFAAAERATEHEVEPPSILVIGQNQNALGQPVTTLSPDDPFWSAHAPPDASAPMRTVFVPIEAEAEVAELPTVPDEAIEQQQPEETSTMARQATCVKAKGGCGKSFEAASTTGKLPQRCPTCKADNPRRSSGSKPRKAKVKPRLEDERLVEAEANAESYSERRRRALDERNRVLANARVQDAAQALVDVDHKHTVRIGVLTIDCYSTDALDALVQRYGAAS
jgi:hypothetical protein